MRTVTSLKLLAKARRPVVLAVGFFDGVHRGHAAVIRTALRKARRLRGEAWVMTFDPHPLDVLAPGKAPPLLTANRHKLKLLQGLGIDGCVVVPFTRRLALEEPEEFAGRLCSSVPLLKEIVVGYDWRFGRGGRGTPRLMADVAGGCCGMRVTVVRPILRGGTPVSSTRIRAAAAAGRLAETAKLLGHPFSVLGVVRRGHAIGRKLGFPTANLDVHNEVLPPSGVYAVCATVDGRLRDGVANLGVRPTFGGRAAKCELELHIFGLSKNLYGHEIEVMFVAKLRNERKFEDRLELAAQIRKDVAKARKALGSRNCNPCS